MINFSDAGNIIQNFGKNFIGGFFLDVICAPYSIPIGFINQTGIYEFDFCYESINKSLNYDKETKSDTVFSQPININTPDITVASRTSVIAQNILNILNKNVQVSFASISGNNKATIINNFSNRDIIHTDEDTSKETRVNAVPNAIELSKIKDENEKGVFHCPTGIHQVVNIELFDFTQTIQNDMEEMYNDISAYTEAELKKNGVDDGSLSVYMENTMKIKGALMENMKRIMIQSTQTNLSVAQGIVYIDNYGYCDNTDGERRGKILKQTIDLRTVAVNIINSSISQIMSNNIDATSTATVTVDRIQNYRIIFCSFIWNIICCYLSFIILKQAIVG